jgi:aryl-alcohol dehydrogenase-like predicted oxidoreductase
LSFVDGAVVATEETKAMTTKMSGALHKVRLGNQGPEVFPLALGCMGMSGMYGPSDEAESIATIQAAIERGVNLLDTGDFYGMGHNEMLIRRAIEGRRDKVLLSVKFGALRTPEGAFSGMDMRLAAVKNFVAYSLKRLGVEAIDIYRPARLDAQVPIEDTIGAIAELVQKGYVRYIGLSEVGADTIRKAARVHPISDLQIEYSLITRGAEDKIFPVLDELGISATLYGILSRGLLSGAKAAGPTDFRAHLPRFSGQNQEQNQKVVRDIASFASARGMTSAQLLVAWALRKRPTFVPTVGSRTRAQIGEALGALDHPLSQADLAELEKLVPKDAIAGTRYDAAQMNHLDSER